MNVNIFRTIMYNEYIYVQMLYSNSNVPKACLFVARTKGTTSGDHKIGELAKLLALVKVTSEQSVSCSGEAST